MRFGILIRALNVLRNIDNPKEADKFLSKLVSLPNYQARQAVIIREKGIDKLFSMAAKGQFDELAEVLGLEHPPKSYAEAMKKIAEKVRLSEIYRI